MLITPAEAAELLGVSEHAMQEWITNGLISHEAGADGQPRIRASFEAHTSAPAFSSWLATLDLHRGISAEKTALFKQQLPIRRREHQLEGLAWTDLDVDALTRLLAARLTEVVPDPKSVHAERGMITVAGSGVDVAGAVADSDQPVEERLLAAVTSLLETVSDALAEVTSEPWPAKAGEFPGGAFPPVSATIEHGELRMAYGEPEHPILELSPITLAAVRVPGSRLGEQ